MQRQHSSYISRQEYLDLERQSETKSEYWNGEIYAMAGASPQHTLIAANMIISLGLQLKGRPCRVHTGDLRVKVSPTGLYTYPDIVIVCGQPKYEDHSAAPIPSIGCELALAEVYDKVEWSSEDAARGWLRFVKEPGEAYLA